MRKRELRHRWVSVMRQLDMPVPLDLPHLCAELGKLRGRPIKLVPFPIASGGPFGLWVARSNVDCIMYQQNTSPIHQTAIIAHELGHIMAGHELGDDGAAALSTLLPGVPPELVHRVLGSGGVRARSHLHHQSPMEVEAETIATMIVRDADILGNQPVQLSSADHESSLGRLRQALYEHRGWQ